MASVVSKNYPFTLWISSILWSAAFLTFAFIIRYSAGNEDLQSISGVFLFTIVFGAAFSWAIFLICYFIFHRLGAATPAQRMRIKIILCICAITGMLGSCAFFGIDLFSFSIELIVPLCYLVGILLATVLTKIEIQEESARRD